MNKQIRQILELLSRGKILRRKIIVNEHSVQILVTPDSQLKYLKIGFNAFDTDLIRIAETFLNKESNVWDIGANVGVFTFAASAVATNGSILSVEADIWLAAILRKSTQLKTNLDKNISVLPVAVSDQNSVARFIIAKRGRASNALEETGGHTQMGGTREVQYVPTMTLDALLENFSVPEFVKIDVEGAELMVLKGAKKLIQEIRPVFYIEITHALASQIFNLFTINNYYPFNVKGEILDESLASNTFFIPREKDKELEKMKRFA
jgi:FkbM family methyltransferase